MGNDDRHADASPLRSMQELEERLRQTESAYEILFEDSIQAVAIFHEKRFVRVNRRYSELCGYEPDELYAMTAAQVEALVAPEDREYIWRSETQRLIDPDLPERYRFRLLRKDGSVRFVEMMVRKIQYHYKPAILSTYQDISELMRAMQQRIDIEARLGAVADNFPDGFIQLIDHAQNILFAAGMALPLLGKSTLRLIGRSVEDVLPPEFVASLLPALRTALTGKRTEFEVRSKDRYISNRIVPVPNSSQSGARVLWVAEDITEQTKSSNRLKAALGEKEALLKELYHRTRNNMQVLRSLLLLYGEDDASEQVKTAFREMEGRIEAMSLAHEELYTGESLTEIDVRRYVDTVTRTILVRHRAAERGIGIRNEIDAGVVLIDIAVPLGLLLNELLTNSLIHGFSASLGHGAGHGETTTSNGLRDDAQPPASEKEIRLAISRTDAGTIHIEYSDSGRGVPEGFDFRSATTMGIRSIFMIVEHQLQGTVRFSSHAGGHGEGVHCEIEFDDTIYEARV